MTIQEMLRIYWVTTNQAIREEVKKRVYVKFHEQYGES